MAESSLFVTCPRGMEALLAAELENLGGNDPQQKAGGVATVAQAADVYRICLWSRLASRVLLPLAHFETSDADALYDAARVIDWPELFESQHSFSIQVAGRNAAFDNSHYAALRVKDAIVDRFRAAGLERPSVDTRNADIHIHLHLGNPSTLSLDLSGESLHRRGYRVAASAAPMKENLACALLTRCGWPDSHQGTSALPTLPTLIDPLCGSGTLVIEAALMACDIAPGLLRKRWGFTAWRGHHPEIWGEQVAEARRRQEAGLRRHTVQLHGSDINPQAIAAARTNAKAAGIAGKIHFEVADALALAPPPETGAGLLLSNLPYGERLSSEAELIRLYSLLGARLRASFGGWHCGLFTSRADLTPRLGLRAKRINSLYNGPIECQLLQFELQKNAGAADFADDLANRLRKNLKHLGRWARRTGVSCYRLYDADLPAYALAIDLYSTREAGLHAHVQEYAAPKSVDPVQAEKRLRTALATILQVLELPPAHLHYKLRRPQKGASQYQRRDSPGQRLTVDEHDCLLQVDFDRYLDTGLFLDHRPLRLKLRHESRGRRVLNLFCYTGAATVHAACGGAARTVSVDLSNTYLEWALDNLKANGIRAQFHARPPKPQAPLAGHAPSHTPSHTLIRADVRAWLAEAAKTRQHEAFDIIFMDPPTFSNSKTMDQHFDIQRDHPGLIRDALQLLTPAGTLYFSTNRRGFKLDQALAGELHARDITGKTLDEDFRRPPPAHRCWAMTRP